MDDRRWVSDDEFASMELERTVFAGDTAAQRAQRIFEESVPEAALRITELARRAGNENVRLRAAQYVCDRVLGKVGEAKGLDKGKDLFEELLGVVTRDATEAETAAIDRAKNTLG